MKKYWKLGVVVLMLSAMTTTLSGCLSLGFGDDDDDKEVVVVDKT
jgi:hypothetical protein